MIRVRELQIKVYVKEDMNVDEMSNNLRDLIDRTLCKSDEFKKFHEENKYKNYCFDRLMPFSTHYKEDEIYKFKLRSVDYKLVKYLKENMIDMVTKYFKVLKITECYIGRKHMISAYTLTPLIVKFEEGYWRTHFSIEDIEKRIKYNLIKKYNRFCGVKLDENFELFTRITLLNEKPLKVRFKDVSLCGDKFEFEIANNKQAQEIMYFALGVGLGELNARGQGFLLDVCM